MRPIAMNARDRMCLRGPVRSVVNTCRRHDGRTQVDAFVFDVKGRLTSQRHRSDQGAERLHDLTAAGGQARPGTHTEWATDGGRIESQPIEGIDGWTMEGLHDVAFVTCATRQAGSWKRLRPGRR